MRMKKNAYGPQQQNMESWKQQNMCGPKTSKENK